MLLQHYLFAIFAFSALGITLGAAIIYIIVCPRKRRKKKSIKTSYEIGGNRNSGAIVGKDNIVHNHYSPAHEDTRLENDNVYRRMCRALDAKDQEIALKNAEIELKNTMLVARDKSKAFQQEELKRKNKELDRRQRVIERKDEDIKDMQTSISHLFGQLQQKDIEKESILEKYHATYLKQEEENRLLKQENKALHNQLWEHVRTYMAPIDVVDLKKLLGEGKLTDKEVI